MNDFFVSVRENEEYGAESFCYGGNCDKCYNACNSCDNCYSCYGGGCPSNCM